MLVHHDNLLSFSFVLAQIFSQMFFFSEELVVVCRDYNFVSSTVAAARDEKSFTQLSLEYDPSLYAYSIHY